MVKLGLLGVAFCAFQAAFAQDLAPSAANSQEGYSLKVSSRLVIEDVTVTDTKGKPVRGLPGSSFHIFDNNIPQRSLDFREGEGNSAAAGGVPYESQSSAPLPGNGGTVVSILIDPMTLELQDQMYLRVQAMRFVQTAPAGVRIAVFRANNLGIPVLLQAPTTDRALLRAAVTQAVPVIVRPVYSTFGNAIAEIRNISDYLRMVPGNKALLWMAGRFPLYQPPDATQVSGIDEERMARERKEAFRSLEQARIALYPVDARGVQPGGMMPTPVANVDEWANDPSISPKGTLGPGAMLTGQYDTMDLMAEATGGEAFYSNNSIAGVMTSAVQLATSSYNVSYQPRNYKPDGTWHEVRVTVDGPYNIHYRRGYYADSSPTERSEQRRLQTADQSAEPQGTSAAVPVREAAGAGAPLIFNARVVSAAKQGKDTTVKIRYVIPTDQLQYETGSGTGHARFRLAVLAYNAWGDVLSHSMEVIETKYTAEQMKLAARIGTPADQELQVAKGAQYLLLAVEDLKTEKVGTLQLQLSTVQAEAAPAEAKTTP